MRAKTRGLTIVEVLVALAIAAVALGMFSYLIDSLNRFRTSQSKTVALNFARRYIDVTRSLWQDPGYFADGAVPSLSPPTDFDCTVFLSLNGGSATKYNCASGNSAVAGAGLNPTAYRDVQVVLRNIRGDNVTLSSQVAAPFMPQPLAKVGGGNNGNGGK